MSKAQNTINKQVPGWLVAALSSWGFFASLLPLASAQLANSNTETAAQGPMDSSNLAYQKCRRETLTLMKEGKLSAQRLKTRLHGCGEHFPGASLYINCKKKAIKSAKGDRKLLPSQLADCKNLGLSASFKPEAPLPYFAHHAKIFFAGVGVNKALTRREMDLPNFDCQRAVDLLRNPAGAEFFLFGNHPRWFKGFGKVPPTKLADHLRLSRAQLSVQGAYLPGLGKLFGDPQKATANLYLPSASCTYRGDLGRVYAGLSSYYLIDSQDREFLPYFTIAFYHPRQSQQRPETLTQALLALLNAHAPEKPYQTYRKDDLVTFLAAAPITAFDEEGDPRDLCSPPRTHRYLGVVRRRKDKPSQPDYISLANIAHLCKLGDKLSERFRP